MPLPGTKVIHDGWAERHQPTAEGGMTATVAITRSGDGETYNPATGTTTPAAATAVWSGLARVQPLAVRADSEVLAGQVITGRRYLVQVPLDTPDLHVGDLVAVTAADDGQLTGQTLRVVDVPGGSLAWVRDLVCVDDLTAG